MAIFSPSACRSFMIPLLLLALLSCETLYGQIRRYVKPVATGNGNGVTWADASADLQAMIDYVAVNGSGVKEVWVSAGTYLPTTDPSGNTTPGDPRDKTFYVRNNVRIYGGFDGSETALSQRNISGNVTVLSGDMASDDVIDPLSGFLSNTTDENAYHVVVAAAPLGGGGVTVDGFLIRGGYANQGTTRSINGRSIPRNCGAGIYVVEGINTFRNNTFLLNEAGNDGGGIYTDDGSSTLADNIFHKNRAFNGGAAYLINAQNTLSGNHIEDNQATYGAGFYSNSSFSSIHHNRLFSNKAQYGGGAYLLFGISVIEKNILDFNQSVQGGGVCLENGADTLRNNLFLGNTGISGGGMYVLNANAAIVNNTMYGNSSANGGGIYSQNGTNILKNNIFQNNLKSGSITAAGCDYYADGTNGNTFTNNLMQLSSSHYPVSNTGNYAIGAGAAGNLFAQHPRFMNEADPYGPDNLFQTADDGLQLLGCSPAIDAGTNTGAPATDILGNATYNGLKDIGAYERQIPIPAPLTATIVMTNACGSTLLDLTTSGASYLWSNGATTQDITVTAAGVYTVFITDTDGCLMANGAVTATLLAPRVIYVNTLASTGNDDGTGWTNAFRGSDALQKGLDATQCVNDEVWVAAGAYQPTKDPFGAVNPADPRDKTFCIKDGTKVYGGFAGTETSIGQRNIAANVTTLSGDFNNDDVLTGNGLTLSVSNNAENAYHVVLASASSSTGGGVTIDGFTITGGNANSSSTYLVNGNVISRRNGGGVLLYRGLNTFIHNICTGNTATSFGGGVYMIAGSANTGIQNVFSQNSAHEGGGIAVLGGAVILNNTVFQGNKASYGGGVSVDNCTGTLNNNTFTENSGIGGGVYTDNGTNVLNNNIFWNNSMTSGTAIAGVDYYANGVNNNTLKNNLLQLESSQYPVSNAGAYAIGAGASNNLFQQDALLFNAADPDGADNHWRTADDGIGLRVCSPAIDAGISAGMPVTDMLGNAMYNGLKDLGAYERQSPGVPLPSASIAVTNGCGSAVLDLTTTGSSYLWSNGATTEDITVTVDDTYTVTVISVPGCAVTATAAAMPAIPTASIVARDSCGRSLLDLTTTGISYAWSNGAAMEDITVTTAGTYSVIVANANGCTVTAAATATPYGRGLVYVNAGAGTGNDDGTTWANAYRGQDALQKALETAICQGDEIWVAAGQYKPTKDPLGDTSPADLRQRVFYLRDGVNLYGGFAGFEAAPAQRNIPANTTILSGDFDGDDVVTGSGSTLAIANNAENAHHVVVAAAAEITGTGITIDGFTITGGNAPLSAPGMSLLSENDLPATFGGGISILNGANTLLNNTFWRNSAYTGGGVYVYHGINFLSNNIFIENLVTEGNGGAGAFMHGSSNVITSNTFSGNCAPVGIGGGLAVWEGTSTISSNTFVGNASYYGGGAGVYFESDTLTNNVFAGNTSGYGGGLALLATGGGVIRNNTLHGNSADTQGGGLYTYDGLNTLINTLFWQNQQAGDAALPGADYYADGTPGNTFQYNLFQLTSSDYTTAGAGNYDLGTGASDNLFAVDPLFANAADPDGADDTHRTADDGLVLQLGSPAKNTGTSTGAPASDIIGMARPQDGGIDIGAYEWSVCTLVTPAVAIASSDADNLVCDGTSITFTATPTNGGSAPVYQWQVNSAHVGSNSSTYTYQPANGDLVSVQMTANNVCQTTAAATSVVPPMQVRAHATAPVLTGSGVTRAATMECTEAGWTYYYAATGELLLSLQKNGNDIGGVGDGTFSLEGLTTGNWGPTTAAGVTGAYVLNPNGYFVMNRFWRVHPTTQPVAPMAVRTYWVREDLYGLRTVTGDAVLEMGQLKMYKINGGYNPDPSLGHYGIPAATAYDQPGYWEYNRGPVAGTNTWRLDSVTGANRHYMAEYMIRSFSGGGGGGSFGGANSNPLFPVEWLSFEATPAGDAVVLDWTTASEQNNASFTAERSLNGVDFEAVGAIAAIGNSSTPVAYSLTDPALPAATTLHYRIRQTDIDGNSSHSEIRTVTLNRATGLVAWPNPATAQLTARIPEGVFTLVLTDEAGRVVRTVPTTGQATTISLDLSGLAAGGYILRAGAAAIRVVKE